MNYTPRPETVKIEVMEQLAYNGVTVRASWVDRRGRLDQTIHLNREWLETIPLTTLGEIHQYIRHMMTRFGLDLQNAVFALSQGRYKPDEVEETEKEFATLKAAVERDLYG